ncbi:hypothetical protein H632_c2484p0 [Helicosporidium sp. ATCC 50920]|nr:hypothetical protein H632_c2484p0 [Helicosporidium sp. ATCC 50920]|eukprot:KDD73148.1 hypothetical protein H632_c2484p0 [Helicosporidium sp. ATCC 50920]
MSAKASTFLQDAERRMGKSSTAIYSASATTLTALAVLAYAAPQWTARAVFGSAAYPPDEQHSLLVRLWSSVLIAPAGMAWALKRTALADALKLSSAVVFMSWAGLLLTPVAGSLHVLVRLAFFCSALALGSLPLFQTFGTPRDRARVNRDAGHARSILTSTLFGRRRTVLGALFWCAGLTTSALGWSQLAAPETTMRAFFGYVYGASTLLLWRATSLVVALGISPACLLLSHKAESHQLGSPVARALCWSMLASAIAYVLPLAPLQVRGDGGPLLPLLVGAWVASGTVAMLGGAADEVEKLAEKAVGEGEEAVERTKEAAERAEEEAKEK